MVSYSCVFSWQISQNVFYLEWFTSLVLILESTCFIYTTWNLRETMEQQPHHACEQTKPKQKQDQVTLHSNWPRGLLFDLNHKQCNGIIIGWFHCLTSEAKGRFLVNECVPLTITFHLYFLRIPKVSGMLHHGSLEWVHSKERYFILHTRFWHFLIVFHQKIWVFIIFILFSWWSIEFLQQNINQSETGIGDKKQSVELYAIIY